MTVSSDLTHSERRLQTPEGVELTIQLADRSERAGAFLIDFCCILIAIFVLFLASVWLANIAGSQLAWGGILFLIGLFLLRIFYFIGFELAWRGATPGKRMLGLRVIDRHGRTLGADAIVARNLVREIEVFMPLNILMAGSIVSGELGLFWIALIAWFGIFTLMPIFNRDRLRVGDMIAGTWVIAMPKAKLPEELTSPASPASPRSIAAAAAEPVYQFADAQLDIYGIYELQTLEDLLRRGSRLSAREAQDIAARIARRIAWPAEIREAEANLFLEDFYTAQRARLEKKMLFGKKRRDKNDRT